MFFFFFLCCVEWIEVECSWSGVECMSVIRLAGCSTALFFFALLCSPYYQTHHIPSHRYPILFHSLCSTMSLHSISNLTLIRNALAYNCKTSLCFPRLSEYKIRVVNRLEHLNADGDVFDLMNFADKAARYKVQKASWYNRNGCIWRQV